ncbi:MAG: hypothetical protein A4E73_02470 [Syntrophaceae bacterium PtaU1.Bin231]|nr:MAG: hypothetical protein A4E73_02470 [Syntrophaceae bacterium PtaU1.Bin231]
MLQLLQDGVARGLPVEDQLRRKPVFALKDLGHGLRIPGCRPERGDVVPVGVDPHEERERAAFRARRRRCPGRRFRRGRRFLRLLHGLAPDGETFRRLVPVDVRGDDGDPVFPHLKEDVGGEAALPVERGPLPVDEDRSHAACVGGAAQDRQDLLRRPDRDAPRHLRLENLDLRPLRVRRPGVDAHGAGYRLRPGGRRNREEETKEDADRALHDITSQGLRISAKQKIRTRKNYLAGRTKRKHKSVLRKFGEEQYRCVARTCLGMLYQEPPR